MLKIGICGFGTVGQSFVDHMVSHSKKIRSNVAKDFDINIIADYFIITNVENSGAFLGLGSDFSPVIKSILLLALPVGVLLTVLVYVFKDKSIDKLSLIGYSSIIGGGIGNIYDRFWESVPVIFAELIINKSPAIQYETFE